MFEMRLESLVAQVVRSQLGRHDRPNRTKEALYMCFDVGMHDYSEELGNRELDERARVHVLFHAALEYGSCISVFSAVTDREKYKGETADKIDWTFEIRHDSCWRDFKVFSALYFDMAASLNAARTKLGLKEKAPKDFAMNVFFDMRMGDDVFRWVPVEVTVDPNDQHNYRRFVKVLKAA